MSHTSISIIHAIQTQDLGGENEMIAIRDINPGKEITYDYSTVTWDARWARIHGAWIMECRCDVRKKIAERWLEIF